MPANTGKAGAIYRVACFAGMPAPTDMPWPPCWRANIPASNRHFDAFENCGDVFGEVPERRILSPVAHKKTAFLKAVFFARISASTSTSKG